MKATLALENGKTFECESFTGKGFAEGEIVFNTSMTGYQEILTDPSYSGQMVLMTYPLIGNYGTNKKDIESDKIQTTAFLMKEYQKNPSNFNSEKTIKEYLENEGILGIHKLDTRSVTLSIRKEGAMRAVISTEGTKEDLIKKARNISKMQGADLVSDVSTTFPYFLKNDKKIEIKNLTKNVWTKIESDKKFCVIALDFGIKYNIIRSLQNSNCKVLVLPAKTSAKKIKELNPDGIFLSNGPGDPAPLKYAYKTVKDLIGFKPIFGICLGYQILALAFGAKTFKLPFGHRGANQPVKNLLTSKIEISSQNHSFAVDIESLKKAGLELTHINLNDNTLEGFKHKKYPIFAVQYHPEASPGPHDASYLFEDFTNFMHQALAKRTDC